MEHVPARVAGPQLSLAGCEERLPRAIMNRRELLSGLSCAIPMLSIGRLYAAPAGSPRLLIVFLRGGYDCLNMLVPYASDDYYTLRPNIAIPKPPESLQ